MYTRKIALIIKLHHTPLGKATLHIDDTLIAAATKSERGVASCSKIGTIYNHIDILQQREELFFLDNRLPQKAGVAPYIIVQLFTDALTEWSNIVDAI